MIIRWTDQAFADAHAAYDFIAENNPLAAEGVRRRIANAVAAIAKYSEIGRVGRMPGTRELTIGQTPYLVIYAIAGREIHIVSLLHGSRRWP